MDVTQDLNKILCYGDSNTFGQDPATGERFDLAHRWPGILQMMLGAGYQVIEEGIPGRTATDISDANPKFERDKVQNGFLHFRPILEEHLPIKTLIIYLGTNDLKNRFKRSAEEIAKAIERLIQETAAVCAENKVPLPEIVILSPQILRESRVKPPYQMEGAEARSREFGKYYAEVAERNNCKFIDLAPFIEPGADGMHLEAEAHQKIAELLKEIILPQEA